MHEQKQTAKHAEWHQKKRRTTAQSRQLFL